MHFQKDPIVAQLGKLASSGRTGALRVAGDLGGVIYLRQGDVVYAESPRTPGPARRLGQSPAPRGHGGVTPLSGRTAQPQTRRHDGAAAAADPSPALLSPLERAWAVRESTVDAALELLSGRSRSSRFRASEASPVADAGSMSVEALLAEVSRRQQVIAQLSGLLTADTAVVRNPRIKARSVRVSALQWGLLSCVRDRSTSRSLAWELGQGVFSTTIEVFRLVTLQLLSVVDAPARPVSAGPGESPGHRRVTLSFIRALTGER